MKTFLKAILVFAILAVCILVLNTLTKPKDDYESPSIATSTEAVSDQITEADSIPVSNASIIEQASSSPRVAAEYPQFPTLPESFNAEIKKSVTAQLNEFKTDIKDFKNADASDFSFTSKWEAVQANDRYVSFIVRYEFYTGGAHEGQALETYNYDVVNKKVLTLKDLFASSTDYLTLVSTEARKQLMAKLKTDPDATLLSGTQPKAENFKSFTFKDDIVTIYFPAYAVAPWAAGEQQVSIKLP